MYKLIAIEVDGKEKAKAYQVMNENNEVTSIKIDELLIFTLNGLICNTKLNIATGSIDGVGFNMCDLPKVKIQSTKPKKQTTKKSEDGSEPVKKPKTKVLNEAQQVKATSRLLDGSRGIVTIDAVKAVVYKEDDKIKTSTNITLTIKTISDATRDTLSSAIDREIKSNKEVVRSCGVLENGSKISTFNLTFTLDDLSDVVLILKKSRNIKVVSRITPIEIDVESRVRLTDTQIDNYKLKVNNKVMEILKKYSEIA